MTLQPFGDEQLNFFKFLSLVLNDFPKALRQTFKTMWDNAYGSRPGFQLWDDSSAVRNLFALQRVVRLKFLFTGLTMNGIALPCSRLPYLRGLLPHQPAQDPIPRSMICS